MSSYFLDSSGLVKRYVQETGSTWIRTVLMARSDHTIFVARITEVEANSAFARSVREGKLSPQMGQTISKQLHRYLDKRCFITDLSEEIVKRAVTEIYNFPLRGYDAVQVASAFAVNKTLLSQGETPLIFVSADKRLLSFATALGLQVEDPNEHP